MDVLEDIKPANQSKPWFAKIALYCSMLWIVMMVRSIYLLNQNSILDWDQTMYRPSTMYMILIYFSLFGAVIFSCISLIKKEPWTFVKRAGIILSTMISLIAIGSIVYALNMMYAN